MCAWIHVCVCVLHLYAGVYMIVMLLDWCDEISFKVSLPGYVFIGEIVITFHSHVLVLCPVKLIVYINLE